MADEHQTAARRPLTQRRRSAGDAGGTSRAGACGTASRAQRPPRRAAIPDLAGKTTTAASAGGAAAATAAATAQTGRRRRDSRSGRHLAAADAARLAGPGLGRVLRGLGRRPRRHRPLHVPQRAQRAAAAVQGRLPERVRHGRGRAVEGEVRRLDRPDARRHRAARQRLLRACSSPARTSAARRTTCRRRASSSARATAAASARPASTSRARRRGRSSARASCWPTTARSSSTRARKFQYELGQWTDPEAFLKV